MVSELTRLDAPLETGPMLRWQRKFHESNLSIKIPANSDYTGPLSPWKPKSAKTPRKTPVTPGNSKTPLIFTPGKTPGKSGKTGKTPSKTPAKQSQDRFIPNRYNTDVEMGHYAIMTESENISPSKLQYKQQLDEVLSNGQNPQDARILCLIEKAPKAKEGYINNLKVLYSSRKAATSQTSATRHIPQQPDRILDAPDLLDDYYLSLLDWSSHNHLAVALAGSVYLWNAGNGTIEQLLELQDMDYYISCVSWIKEGNILGVGFSTGVVQLWDAGQQKLVRTMTGHPSRVGSLSWNTYILSSGCRTGAIHHHDVRVPEHHVATLSSHTQEVCGLQWSPDGRHLASGGNDNVLNIWDTNLGSDCTPVHTFTQHQGAVKALAWCPWQQSLLASGGGTADRHIRFWNTVTGTPISETDTNSQVVLHYTTLPL
ncbi:hypothetical protein ScPMuIL_018077 [Solemya velum]